MSKFKALLDARKIEPASEPEPPAIPPKTKRLSGKRSNPDFEQVTAYIRRNTYRQVKIALVHEGREFSELVETLLADWVKSNI